MDDHGLGAVQARLTRLAAGHAAIDNDQLWWKYFHLGGAAGRLEVDAYLHACLRLPPAHRDLLARAVNELVGAVGLSPVPSTSELTASPESTGRQERSGAPGQAPGD